MKKIIPFFLLAALFACNTSEEIAPIPQEAALEPELEALQSEIV